MKSKKIESIAAWKSELKKKYTSSIVTSHGNILQPDVSVTCYTAVCLVL